ncbi:MAG: hypothetical protein WC211_04025 [Dehalococcoidia bacterium]
MRWFALAAAVIGTLGIGLVAATPAAAQSSAPANFYGKGGPLKAGDRVAILVNGVTCGTSTVNASLEWAVAVATSAPCAPTEGVAVSATVNGGAATLSPAAVWKVGGTPPDIANGYAISVAGGTTSTGGTPTAPGTSGLLSGSVPRNGGYGIIAVNAAATVQQVAEVTGCPIGTMALYATSGGTFLAYVPGTTIGAVNAAFLAAFPNGSVPSGTALLGKCV